MTKSFIFLLCIVLVSISTASTDVSKGEAVFNEIKCYICHGKKAEKKSLNVSEIIQNWSAIQIQEALNGYKAGTRDKYGFSEMMGGKTQNMNEEQIRVVSKYISSLGDPANKLQATIAKSSNIDFIEYVAKKDVQEVKKVKEVKEVKEVKKQPIKKVVKTSNISLVEYIVKKGDTLSSIANSKYKNNLFWTLLYTQNKNTLPDMDTLTVGTKLLIPSIIDKNNVTHKTLLTKSYIDVYKEYKNANRVDDARWLLYRNYSSLNSKILEENKQNISSDDLNEIKHYIKVLQI